MSGFDIYWLRQGFLCRWGYLRIISGSGYPGRRTEETAHVTSVGDVLEGPEATGHHGGQWRAVGAGFSLALNGDLILASETARFGASFLRVGLTPDMGSIHNLVHLLGTSKACELSFMADIIDAKQAEKMGVVNKVVERERLDEIADEWAAKMAKLPFLPLSLLKKAIYKAQDMNFLAGIEDEINLQSLCLLSKDGKEGLKAFLEKRKPNFNT